MANINATPQQMDKLLKIVSAKLGVSAESLKNDLENGKFDNALKNMKPNEAATFNQMVSNPKCLKNSCPRRRRRRCTTNLRNRG